MVSILHEVMNGRLPIFVVLLLAVGCGSGEGSGGYERAPDADIPFAKELDLKAYRGKIVVLNFWATWCGPCRIEIPDLVKLRKSFASDEVAIIGVATGEQGPPPRVQQELKATAAQYGINYELYLDHDGAMYSEWVRRESLFGVPSTLLFDAKGNLKGKHLGVPRDRRTGRLDPFGVLGEAIQAIIDEA